MLSLLCYSIVLGLPFYLGLLAAYRLTLHPLAKYPGPLLSKISSFSIFLHAKTGDRHLILLAEHRKYGPVVRISPNQLSFADPAALRDIYQSGRASNPLRKAEWYETVDAPSGAYSTHTEISRSKHAFRRRVMEQAFSDSALREFEPLVIENVETLLKVIEASPELNISTLATYFTYDVMGDLVFGEAFHCLTSEKHRFMPRLIMAGSASIYAIAHLPLQWLIRPIICSQALVKLFGGQLEKDGLAYIAYANNRVTQRLNAPTTEQKPRLDIMHHLITARDPETKQPFTRHDLDAESSLLIAAGADTTSTTLAATLFYLTLPSSLPILHHLTTQLRTHFPTPSTIHGTAITAHPLLRATIDEALRLSPPAPSHLPRTVVADPGIAVAGHFIPRGTTIGVAAYVVHRDPLAFPRADEFLPERWLVDPDAEERGGLRSRAQVERARKAFSAFSMGSRGCVGKGLAYLELCLVLGRVLWEFDVERVGGSEEYCTARTVDEGWRRGWVVDVNEFQLKDQFLAERDGPMLRFRRRADGVGGRDGRKG